MGTVVFNVDLSSTFQGACLGPGYVGFYFENEMPVPTIIEGLRVYSIYVLRKSFIIIAAA